MENEDNKITKKDSELPSRIDFKNNSSVDLSWLSENERKALLLDYTKGEIDINKRAKELQVEAVVLKKTLDDLSDTTIEMSNSGNAVTISHTQKTELGRTEIMMGNTEQAMSGKLSKSQTGEKNWTPFYFIAIVVAIILIIALSN